MQLPVLAGPLRGRRWLVASRGKVLRVLLGTYEPEQTALFRRWLRAGDTVLDVGAHAGYYTLLSAVLVGERGRIWAFEPNPVNAGFLREHVRINGLAHVNVEQAAVADRTGSARFDFGGGSGTGHLAPGGALEVRTVQLDEYCARHGITPHALKVDVEGAELDVLRGAGELLRRDPPLIFLSTHGQVVHGQCLALLRGLDYQVRAVLGDDPDAASEVLCVPPGRR